MLLVCVRSVYIHFPTNTYSVIATHAHWDGEKYMHIKSRLYRASDHTNALNNFARAPKRTDLDVAPDFRSLACAQGYRFVG